MKGLRWERLRSARRMLGGTLDRPRRIDRVIDFFGERRPAGVGLIPRGSAMPRAGVCHG